MNQPAIHVIYGQSDHLSTSFQTSELTLALRKYFKVTERRFANRQTNRCAAQLRRIWSNFLEPVFSQPKTDFVFYGNDGVADLRQWKTTTVVYWYDAPSNWARTPPHRRQLRHWLRY